MWHFAAAGEGKPLIFLHGFPDFSYLWRKQIRHFSEDYHVITPDLPGYNLSSKSKELESYQLIHLAKSLHQFIRKLALKNEKVTLIGHDWGGVLAWTFAMYYPDVLEQLIIINAPHPLVFEKLLATNKAQQAASEYVTYLLQTDIVELLAVNNFSWLKAAFINKGLAKGIVNQEDVREYEAAWSEPGAIDSMVKYYQASFQCIDNQLQFISGLEQQIIPIPTTVIWGVEDQALRLENLEGLDDLVNDLTIVRVDDADHWLVHEKPEKMNAIIEKILADREG